MDNIRATANLVKTALTEHPATRNSDEYLYYKVCSALLEKQGKDISTINLASALLNRKTHGLPKFETVRRTRQKLQATFPELASTEKIAHLRAEREQDYREYAREG